MALDELHARRIATTAALVEDAMKRIEAALRDVEERRPAGRDSASLSPAQVEQLRREMESVRKRLAEITSRFSVQRHKPEARQLIAAELSALWVILENALPERMKGYGREFQQDDRADWERLIRALIHDTDRMRRTALERKTRS